MNNHASATFGRLPPNLSKNYFLWFFGSWQVGDFF
jgi:hypothetical protein